MESNFTVLKALLALFLALGVQAVGLVAYRLIFHPLAIFPGPRLAAITRYYEFYYDVIKGGQYTFKIAELHKEYGPIVRISPYELHVIDPNFYDHLYRQDGRWDKYGWMYNAFGVLKATICTINHDVHKQRRTVLNTFFSKAKVAAHKDMIQDRVQKLVDHIDKFAVTGEVLNLGYTYTAMAMDIITKYTIKESCGNLDDDNFSLDLIECIQNSGSIWRLATYVTWLMPLFASMPLWMIKILDEKGTNAFSIQDCTAQTKRVMSANETGSVKEKSRQTMVYQILNSPQLSPSERSFARLEAEIATITGAGLEATAHALRVITYHIYSTPTILRRLRAELTTLSGSLTPLGAKKWTLRQLEQLPYSTAVPTEGLRIAPAVATRLARTAPDRDITLGAWKIPAGTPIGMTAILMHHDENIYPNPRTFDPERWTDLAQKRQLEKYYAPFSRGTRNCMGMHLAWAELCLTVAAIVSRYDFEFAGTRLSDVECGSDQFTIGTKTQNGIKVRVRNC